MQCSLLQILTLFFLFFFSFYQHGRFFSDRFFVMCNWCRFFFFNSRFLFATKGCLLTIFFFFQIGNGCIVADQVLFICTFSLCSLCMYNERQRLGNLNKSGSRKHNRKPCTFYFRVFVFLSCCFSLLFINITTFSLLYVPFFYSIPFPYFLSFTKKNLFCRVFIRLTIVIIGRKDSK